jgi:methyl-accepting chemotaxis protein
MRRHGLVVSSALLALCAALLVPGAAQAQPKLNPALLADSLTEQEREMLGLAQDFAARCTQQLEAWIAKKEVTSDQLFANLYYPMAKTDPPKFTTDWDRLSDRDIQAIEEAVLGRSPTILFAVLVDRQGYLPTHNLKFSMPLTGNLANDLVNNRTKRLFSDRTGLAAARSEAPFLIQRYLRDTGEVLVDLSVPVVVQGVHWGAVRIGYRQVDSR